MIKKLLLFYFFLIPISNNAFADSIKFKIAISAPFSGAFAEYGEAINNGIALAQKDHPDNFKHVSFVFEDNEYQPKTAVTAFNKALDLDKVDLTFIWGNEPVLAVTPIAERRRHPTIIVSQDPTTAIGRRYTIRFLNPFSDYAKALIAELRKRKISNIGIIKTEISFFQNMTEALQALLKNNERITVIETVLPTVYDFRTTIAKLAHQDYGIVGVFLPPVQVKNFYRQLAESKIRLKTFGSTPFESKVIISESLGQMDGAFYSQLDVNSEFQRRYLQKFGNDVQISYAANAYDFAMLVGELFGNLERELSAEEILDSFRIKNARKGMNGTSYYKETATGDRYFQFEMAIKRIQSGQIFSEKVILEK